MKRFLVATLLGLFSTGGLAAPSDTPPEADVVITTGSDGGNYHRRFGKNLGETLTERGWETALWESKGSLMNAARIDAGDADLGFLQGDALAYYLKQNASSSLDPLAKLSQECFFVAVADDSPIDDIRDLNSGQHVIGVGSTDGGTYASWLNLQTLEPYLKEPVTKYRNGPRALAKLLTGDYDAVAWVTARDGLGHENFEIVLPDDSGLRMISVGDWNLNDQLPSGEAVYSLEEIDVKTGWLGDTEVTVPCMDMYVVGNANGDEDLLDAVAIEAMTNRSRLVSDQ